MTTKDRVLSELSDLIKFHGNLINSEKPNNWVGWNIVDTAHKCMIDAWRTARAKIEALKDDGGPAPVTIPDSNKASEG